MNLTTLIVVLILLAVFAFLPDTLMLDLKNLIRMMFEDLGKSLYNLVKKFLV